MRSANHDHSIYRPDPPNGLPRVTESISRKAYHTFPYAELASTVLASIPRFNDYLFPAARERQKGKPATVFNGWSKRKVTFDRACPVQPWTLHDLRRTFATNLAALGAPIHVTEKLLNHISGAVSGVAAVYNRHAYLDEMRIAIEAWEARLTTIVKDNSATSPPSTPPE